MQRNTQRKLLVLVLLLVFVTYLTGGFAVTFAANESSPDPQNNSESSNFSGLPVVDDLLDDLLEAMAGLLESMRTYMEEVRDMIPGIGDPEPGVEPAPEPDVEPEPEPAPEPEPEPEPAPPETDVVPTAGTVEGWLADEERNPLSMMRVVMGPYETTTDRNGYFFFEDVDFGSYELYLADPSIPEEVFLTSFRIDETAPNYTVNLAVSLPEDETEEAEVIAIPEEEDEPSRTALVLLGIIALLVIAVIVLLLLKRKHIRIVDAKTGQVMEKRKLEIRPKTKIDLTEAFEYAHPEGLRVQFLSSAVKKLSGCRILFLKDGKTVAEIDEYAGELDYPVKLPEITEEAGDNGRNDFHKPGEPTGEEPPGKKPPAEETEDDDNAW